MTITDDLVIRGPGAHRLTVSGQEKSRVFRIDADPTQRFGVPVDDAGAPLLIDVEIHRLTIADGLATDAPGFPPFDPAGNPLFPGFGFGGGLYNRGNNVNLVGIRFEDNRAGSEVLPIDAFGADATYDQATGDYTGPAGTSNLGPIVLAGSVDLPVVPTIFEPNPTTPGEIFFQAPFSGAQTITDVNNDVLAGSFEGEVVFKLGDLGTPEVGLPVGEWNAFFEIDPLASTGRFTGATGVADIVAFNPPGFDPFAATLPFDWTITGDIDLPVGGAAGGAIANEFGGTLEVSHGHFQDNVAQGGLLSLGGAIVQDIGPTPDGVGTDAPTAVIKHSTFRGNKTESLASNPDTAGPFAPFAGWSLGGAIANVAGRLEVSGSRFDNNGAHGGDGAVTDTPVLAQGDGGNAIGGAINIIDFSPFDVIDLPGRDATIEIRTTRFSRNGAFAGDAILGGKGGQGIGGAIGFGISYDETLGFSGDSGVVSKSSFAHNVAQGGEGGSDGGTGGNAAGGAIALTTGAGLDVEKSRFRKNEARGGDGPGDGQGGDGLGGAIGLDVLTTLVPIPGLPVGQLVSTVDVYGSYFAQNLALGGDAGIGGNGLGGAVGTAGPIDSVFGLQSTSNIVRSLIKLNRAAGGEGDGSDGGDGLGGGVYNGYDADTTLRRSVVSRNEALGGSGGEGIGGGIYNLGDLDEVRSRIFANLASTDFDDCFGC